MKFMSKILILTSLLFLMACAVTPLSDPITAKNLGRGNSAHGITIGYPFVGYTFNYGVTDSLDVGLQSEYQTSGLAFGTRLMLKAFEYDEAAWNMSLLSGVGLSTSGHYVYGGVILSKKYGIYELAIIPRMNFFEINRDLDSEDIENINDNFSFEVEKDGKFYFLSLGLANTFWLRENFGFTLTVNGAYLFPWKSGDNGFAAYGGIGFLFKN